ncbi:unnamed protein product [marine sediment metagenome]|uniref:Uncharacterized protein n=1 Tax=marine sediment metagenome TaxID=412755 RepID=X0SZH5_9ZZZZ
MYVEPNISKNKDKNIKKKDIFHMDYDKSNEIFYNNLYFCEQKVVLKMPLMGLKNRIRYDDIKIEEFDITKYVYLLYYD